MRRKRWLRRFAVVFLAALVAVTGLSRVLRAHRVHGYLTSRLEAALGRPVEVSRFNFSLLTGPRLEAEQVTVAEDPRFGHEYFLRAERLTAGLRWQSLAQGRFEFGIFAFTRPSLNLARGPDGHWNVESWLPPPERSVPARTADVPARLYRIEVEDGRINFKRGAEKHPFAFVAVSGHVEQEGAGRWLIDLEARPMRAAVPLQQTGLLHLRGRIAGTSARLQPAELALAWREASLADAVRLLRGQDYGVRGRLAGELVARVPAAATTSARLEGTPEKQPAGESARAAWSFKASARLENVHRWDRASRPGDPALNLRVEAQWRPDEAQVEFTRCLVEAPRSRIHVAGKIRWAPTFEPAFQVESSGIGLADLMAWYRAFRAGVADDLRAEGNLRTELVVSGWPLRLQSGTVSATRARIVANGLSEPVRVGAIVAGVRDGRLQLEATTLSVASENPWRGTFLRVAGGIGPGETPRRMQARAGNPMPTGKWRFEVNLAGQTDRAQDLLRVARALGYGLYRGWNAEGSAVLRLQWQGTLRPFTVERSGLVELRGARLETRYLNRPINNVNAIAEFQAGRRRFTVLSAQGLGTRWKGTLGSPGLDQPWAFDLSAERIDLAELDRWLGPRARPGLLGRVVTFGARNRGSEFEVALANLHAAGRLTVDEVVISPIRLHRLQADATIQGRQISLRRAQADFYGGSVEGLLEAQLSTEPTYRCQAQLERVNLESLAAAAPRLRGRFSGVARGELELLARGVGRENLVRSLEGRGALEVRDAELRSVDLKATYSEGRFRSGASRFASVEVVYSLAGRRIRLDSLRLLDRGEDFEIEGSVDYARALDLRIGRLSPAEEHDDKLASKRLRITGPFDAPRAIRVETEVRAQ